MSSLLWLLSLQRSSKAKCLLKLFAVSSKATSHFFGMLQTMFLSPMPMSKLLILRVTKCKRLPPTLKLNLTYAKDPNVRFRLGKPSSVPPRLAKGLQRVGWPEGGAKV
jgi:hypothetical protein